MREYRERVAIAGRPLRDSPTWEENQRGRYRRYGLTEQSYLALLVSQGNTCAICTVPLKAHNELGDRKFNTHIDHCHSTGKVRGILCSGCNLGIGHFKDDISKLRAAIAYLDKP